MEIEKVNLNSKLSSFSELWSPKIAGELNGQHIKLAKLKGDFVMHHHENEDELFYVIKGTLFIEMKDKTIELNEGEFVVIPKGVEHKSFAPEEVSILLFEPTTTLNTGNTKNELTVEKPDQV